MTALALACSALLVPGGDSRAAKGSEPPAGKTATAAAAKPKAKPKAAAPKAPARAARKPAAKPAVAAGAAAAAAGVGATTGGAAAGEAASAAGIASTAAGPAAATPAPGDALVLDAREAWRKRDLARLAMLRQAADDQRHPLAPWVDYWELQARLVQAAPAEVEAFFERRSGTYVEDRLRNDWLLELGRRGDWARLQAVYPKFRMNDDREVVCYTVAADHAAGRNVRDAALEAWLAQRDPDQGCDALARTLMTAGVFRADDAWQKIRLAAEQARPRSARAAAALIGPRTAAAVDALWEQPLPMLARGMPEAALAESALNATALQALAVARLAADDPAAAAARLDTLDLPRPWAGWAWSQVGRQAALRLRPEALDHYERARAVTPRGPGALPVSDDTLAWHVRAQLRSSTPAWATIVQTIDAMSRPGREDPAWVYWRARAELALATTGPEGDDARQAARMSLGTIAGQLHFYGKLAAEDLGRPLGLPKAPRPLTAAEREAALANPGLQRAMRLIAIGLRSEGVREWNWTLRGMDDRQLRAAAQMACDREVWDRCIHASERTRDEVDMAQRFPTPHREAVLAQARRAGLDPAYVYGLIRQESRFITDARSHVGASGLMQLMPATARWTARKVGVDFSPSAITDRDLNLQLGTAYLKLVLDDFGGSQAMAAAAYNAGPGRPRRWREGATIEAAAWAENVPLSETRDYVKKVLSNAAYYAALLGDGSLTLKPRLGPPIGPRQAGIGAPDTTLP